MLGRVPTVGNFLERQVRVTSQRQKNISYKMIISVYLYIPPFQIHVSSGYRFRSKKFRNDVTQIFTFYEPPSPLCHVQTQKVLPPIKMTSLIILPRTPSKQWSVCTS